MLPAAAKPLNFKAYYANLKMFFSILIFPERSYS